MGKKQREKLKPSEAKKPDAAVQFSGLALGNHKFRQFTGLDAAFGADLRDYPPYKDIPEQFRRGNTPFNDAVSALFFKGGKLEDFGLRLKPETNASAFFAALRSLLCSFAPPHEHKDAACAWLLSEYTELAPSA